MGATIKSFKRETCTGKWREWQLRKVISRNDLPFHYTLVSSSLNPGIRASQSSKHASKQASAQSVSQLFAVFTVPPRAHPSAALMAALQTPSTFTITFKIVIILGKTHAQSRRAFVNNDFVHRERVLRARDEISPDPVPPDVQRDET